MMLLALILLVSVTAAFVPSALHVKQTFSSSLQGSSSHNARENKQPLLPAFSGVVLTASLLGAVSTSAAIVPPPVSHSAVVSSTFATSPSAFDSNYAVISDFDLLEGATNGAIGKNLGGGGVLLSKTGDVIVPPTAEEIVSSALFAKNLFASLQVLTPP